MAQYLTNRNLKKPVFLPILSPKNILLSTSDEEDEEDEEFVDGVFIYCPGADFDAEYEEIEECTTTFPNQEVH